MLRLLIPVALLVLGLVATWTVGYVLHASSGNQVAISVLITAISLVWLLIAWLSKRAAAKKSAPAAAPISSADGKTAIRELEAHWQQAVAAVKAAQADRQVFSSLPWFLVIGAPGSGKTSVLRDAGLTFSTTADNSQTQTGLKEPAKGTKSFDWFRSDEALFIDTAGRYVTEPKDRDEWFALLRLIKATRRGAPLCGVISCVNISELIKKGESALAAEAKANRDRLDEIVAQLGLVVPVYTMFTKFDSIGGFKDFFAEITRNDKDQVWGFTLPWEQTAPIQQVYPDEYRRLFANLQSRRLATLATLGNPRGEDQLKKLYQFPIQFLAVQKWIGEFISGLIKADHLKEQAVFRGFYFSSCYHPAKLPGRAAFEGGANPAKGPVAVGGKPGDGIEASVFLSTSQVVVNQNAPSPNEAADIRKGFFLKNLFSKVVIADRGLARPTQRALRRQQIARTLCLAVIPLIAILFSIYLGISAAQSLLLVRDFRYPLQNLIENDKTNTPLADRLGSLDALGNRLAALADHPRHRLAPLLENIAGQYFQRLRRLTLDACALRLHDDLDAARAVAAQTQNTETSDQLYDLHRAYQMLAGVIAPDDNALQRTLFQNRRWYAGIESKAAPLDFQLENLAKRQLALIATHPVFKNWWHLDYDKHLVERINTELGDVAWIRQGYEEILRSVQGQFPLVRKDSLVSGPDSNVLAVDDEFSQVFSQEGWDDAMERAIKDKAVTLSRKFAEFNLVKPISEFERKLREQFVNDFNRHWLKFLSSTRLNDVKVLRDVPDRLARLAGAQSPYREFIKRVWSSHALKTSGLDFFSFSSDNNKWIDPALEAVAALNEDIKAFLTGTEPGKRSADLTKLKELALSFTKASQKVGEVVKIIESPEKRAAVQSGMDNILRSAFAALAGEVKAEQDHIWREKAAVPFADRCAKRFPFDPAATNEVTLPMFSKLFNPTSGELWNAVHPVESLRMVQALGGSVMPVSPDYERLLKKLQDIKTLCFDGNSDTVSLPFTITLMQREGVKDLNFAFGEQSISLYDVPDARFQIRIKEGKSAQSKVAISIVTGQWMTREYKGEWSFLRLLRDGSPTLRQEGNSLCTWLFDAKAAGNKVQFKASAIVEANGIEKAVVGDLFTGFACPETISQ